MWLVFYCCPISCKQPLMAIQHWAADGLSLAATECCYQLPALMAESCVGLQITDGQNCRLTRLMVNHPPHMLQCVDVHQHLLMPFLHTLFFLAIFERW
jgi:hypothetical protein